MKARIGLALVFSGALLCLAASEQAPVAQEVKGEWLTDLAAAKAKAKAGHKTVLLDFTGSDWCQPCIRLRKTILDSAEFLKFAQTNLVLVEVDFPEKKELPKELEAANKALAKQFNVEGYPTVILVNGDGKVLDTQAGPNPASPKDFIGSILKAETK